MKKQLIKIIIPALFVSLLIFGVLLTGGYYFLYNKGTNCSATTIAGGKANIGGPFSLINHLGERVSQTDVINKPSLVYFGFTFCPDFCPLDMARNIDAVALMKKRGLDVQNVFISFDPTRDTPEVLSDYVENMDPEMIALTGTPEEIDAAKKKYKVFSQKRGDDEYYVYSHSTFTYFMDPAKGMLEFFKSGDSPEKLASVAGCYLNNQP